MGSYAVSDKAASDLAEIEEGHLRRGGSQRSADLLVQEFLESFQSLADFPDLGTPRDYLRLGELALPQGDYLIIYRKGGEQSIDILHVVWGRLDLRRYFSEQS